jgi:GTP-binding protein LepA
VIGPGMGCQVCNGFGRDSRHQFKIAIQGAIGKIIPVRSIFRGRDRNATEHYKSSLKTEERQRRMKMVGSVMIPQNAFVAVLKSKNE